MTRWSATTRTRGGRSALAYGSRSTTAAEEDLQPARTPRTGTLLTDGARTFALGVQASAGGREDRAPLIETLQAARPGAQRRR